jgi:hypothetical protein
VPPAPRVIDRRSANADGTPRQQVSWFSDSDTGRARGVVCAAAGGSFGIRGAKPSGSEGSMRARPVGAPPLLALPSPCPMCSSSLFAASGTKPSEAPGASAGDLGPTPGSTGAREPRRCTSTLLIGNYAADGVTQVGRYPAGATSSRPQAGPRAGSRRHCAMTIGLRAGSRSVSRRCARPPRPACRKTRRVPTVRSAPFFAGRYGSAACHGSCVPKPMRELDETAGATHGPGTSSQARGSGVTKRNTSGQDARAAPALVPALSIRSLSITKVLMSAEAALRRLGCRSARRFGVVIVPSPRHAEGGRRAFQASRASLAVRPARAASLAVIWQKQCPT